MLGDDNALVASSLYELGNGVFTSGKFDPGTRLLEQAVDLDRRILGPNDRQTLTAQMALGGAFFFQQKYTQAESLLASALSRQRKAFGPDDPDIMTTLEWVGIAQDHLEKVKDSEANLRQAIAMGERHLDRNHPLVLRAIGNLASLLARIGPYPRADSIYSDLMARLKAAGLVDYGEQAAQYGALLIDMGRPAEAESVVVAGIADLDRFLPRRDNSNFVYLFARLGLARQARGNNADAVDAFTQALTIAQRVYGPDAVNTATVTRRLGVALERTGRLPEARDRLAEALALRTKIRPHDHPERIESLMDLARVDGRLKRYADAEPLLLDALHTLQSTAKPDTAAIADVRRNLASLYAQWGRPREAAEFAGRG